MAAGLADQLSFERLVSRERPSGLRFPHAKTGCGIFSLQQPVDFSAKSAKFTAPFTPLWFLASVFGLACCCVSGRLVMRCLLLGF